MFIPFLILMDDPFSGHINAFVLDVIIRKIGIMIYNELRKEKYDGNNPRKIDS